MSTLLLVFFTTGIAQKVWTLNDCINYAIENNISVKQAELSTKFAENQVFQDKMNMYTPFVQSDISHNFNYGNSVDPLTYEFIRENTQSTRMSISGSYSFFEGLSRMRTLQADKDALGASSLELEELKNTTKLLVANNYLQILIASEVYLVALERAALTQNQYYNTQELVNAGVRAKGDLFELDAQLANDELSIVNAENTMNRALNQLKLLLQLDPYTEISIAGIEPATEFTQLIDPKNVGAMAMEVMPNIKGAEMRYFSAQKRLQAAKGSLSPTLSVTGYVGTNYFSAARQFFGFDITGTTPIGFVNGTNEVVSTFSTSPITGDLSFGQQFSSNINQSVGLNLSIPIFGKWQRVMAIQNAKLNIISAEYAIENKKNELQQDVYNAYTDMTAAVKKYHASEKSLNAAQKAYEYADEKFKAGMLNALEFETAKNRLVLGQAESIQAKYEFAFRKMIVNFYQTGKVEL